MEKNTIGLVTGASSGLGAEFCRQLSQRCRTALDTATQRVDTLTRPSDAE